MRESSGQDLPSPWVVTEQLSGHVKKSVMYAGKVIAIDQRFLTLDGGDGARPVKVQRAIPSSVHIEQGMTVLVRGFVNEDLSISESPSFPPTVLGDNFDLRLAASAVSITSNPSYSSMFC